MTIIVNGQRIEWPTPYIREDQIRQYADATHNDDVWQHSGAGQQRKVVAIADMRFGHMFDRKPKGETT